MLSSPIVQIKEFTIRLTNCSTCKTLRTQLESGSGTSVEWISRPHGPITGIENKKFRNFDEYVTFNCCLKYIDV